MDETKSIFASKGFWGGVMALLAGIGGIFGYVLAPDDQAALVEIITAVIASVGGVTAIWGRFRATKQIK